MEERRTHGHSSRMRSRRRTAYADVTATTVLWAALALLLVAGRFGWHGLLLASVVVLPVLSAWVQRRVDRYRRMR